ncbi:DIP1984 family protein [Paenibacillus sp. 1P07SE]|uniref:DIP1984 family protein n=1 Tax=Paenibacillus sp. 1P07SE TaxID=3132209 RepID=UPI0039A4DBBE
MRLAEALVLRADSQKKVAQMRGRLERVVKVQEGESPAESPTMLLDELEETLNELTRLVRRINRTNVATTFDEALTLADALAERDKIMQHRKILNDLLQEASIKQERYSRSEVRFERTIDVAALQGQIDQMAKSYRELDFRIQELNWTTDVVDDE